MNDYTAEDFKNAMFAVLPKYGLRAHKSAGEFYWQRDGIKRATNPEMAAAGWRPVHEHTPHSTDALEEEIQDLRDEVRDLKAAPLTLDTLREAWENAEVPTGVTPIRDGDTAITQVGEDDFAVYRSCTGVLTSAVRILHRAPQPEPWQALADVMRQWDATPETGHSADSMARWFYERGVRVTGGDET